MNDFIDGAGDRVRVGDAERDSAAAALGEHYSEGRLDRAEFDARLADALAARTRGDLAVLFTDLPKSGQLVALEARPPSPARAPAAGGLSPAVGFWLPKVIILLAVVAAVGAAAHGHPPVFLLPLLWLTRVGRRGRFRPGPR
ncbi:MAG TPA: DUF1707 domain-containing protein [Actinocrinis sp.]|nr:DUF1707 domain-containing protein [Actinocrinis sp.]